MVIYPLVLNLISIFVKSPLRLKKDYEPEITILIAAYNEEELITDCLNSVLNCDYPKEKMRILVGSDGSTDRTNEIVKSYQDNYDNIQLFEYGRSGKNKVLNELVKNVKTEISFFLDADLRLRKDSLRNLVGILSDEKVGAALASVNIVKYDDNLNAGSHGESVYQKYESFLRAKESEIHSNINSLGTLYGIKTEYFKPFPSDTVCDDLFNVFSIALKDKRIIFDKNTIVDEVRLKSLNQEFFRRVRVVAGGLSTISYSSGLISPAYGWSSFFIWSHKMLRWFSPIFVILIFILTFLVPIESEIKTVLIWLQLFLYFSAFIGFILEKAKISVVFFKLAYFYLSMNAAFFVGILRFLQGKQNAAWDRQGLSK